MLPWAGLALLIVAFDFIYQDMKTKDRDPAMCFWAFRHNRWVGLIIWLGIVLALSISN